MEPFFEFSDVPGNSVVQMTTRDDAVNYPRGDILLGFCDTCGFICNLTFDERLTEYSDRYEETQGYSATFRDFHERIAHDLLDRHRIRNKDVIEIGCGKGEFLALLCRLGPNHGLGFDPSYDDSRHVLADVPAARVIADFYSSKYSDRQADLVCCKMTLEHIPETAEFAALSRRAMKTGKDSLIYFLVPNARRILEECSFEDIYYEHCNYFTSGSLARLFRAQGVDVERLAMEYSNQYLALEGRLADTPTEPKLPEEDDLDEIRELVSTFRDRCDRRISDWRERLKAARKRGPTVVWGSGSKAVAFLGAVDQDNVVERVVDINPHRQGHFVLGSGQPIISPSALTEDPPATVIAMNPVYKDEIATDLKRIGLNPEILTL